MAIKLQAQECLGTLKYQIMGAWSRYLHCNEGSPSLTFTAGFYTIQGALTISWSKSALMMLDREVNPHLSFFCRVPVVMSFKYLGIVISSTLTDYPSLNILLLISRLGIRSNCGINYGPPRLVELI